MYLQRTWDSMGDIMEKDLTTGSVFKNIVYFSLPYLLSYFLQTLYGMADLFIIGQFEGVASTTAVSIGSQVMHMITVIIVGLAMGSTVCIGQSVGGKDSRKASKYTGNTITLFMGLSIVLTAGLLLLRRPIVQLMSTPDQAVEGTIDYLTICFIGIPFITAYNITSSIFRGLGDSRSPMYFIAIACAANIGLDYLFMGPMHLGPSGAALGTTLSQAISVLVSVLVIRRRKTGIALERNDFKPHSDTMGGLLKIGVPIAVQDGLIQVAFIVITVIANRRGLNDAAAVGIVEKIMSFIFLVPSSMLSTVSALGAQNIGAGKPKRAQDTLKYGIIITTCFGVAVMAVVQLCAESFVALFTDPSTLEGMQVVRMGGQYLRGYIWDCLFAGIHFCFSGYFCACGKSYLSFVHNIIAITFVRIPGAYITSRIFTDTLFPMGLATAAGSMVSVVICLVAYWILLKKESDVPLRR